MNYILFDNSVRLNLLPLTYTRPVCDIRVGILTVREKWELYLETKVSCKTEQYLSGKFPMQVGDENILINGSICPEPRLLNELAALEPGQALTDKNRLIAVNLCKNDVPSFDPSRWEIYDCTQTETSPLLINYPWDIFSVNGRAIEQDFQLLTKDREGLSISETNRVFNKENIFIEEGAIVECSVLNASAGPIYIGQNAEVMEGALIRGPFALGEGAVLKMGAKIYGATTVGPYSKVGGEVNNCVIAGFSNKGHDGFIGNSVIGEWCNLGADTNTSNLKNNYSDVKVWSYKEDALINSGLQFCGLIMGDHSKCSINTMFNTGTTVGVCANIFGSGFPPKFVPSFAWGGIQEISEYNLDKAFEVAERVVQRRNLHLSQEDKDILKFVFNDTAGYRKK